MTYYDGKYVEYEEEVTEETEFYKKVTKYGITADGEKHAIAQYTCKQVDDYLEGEEDGME